VLKTSDASSAQGGNIEKVGVYDGVGRKGTMGLMTFTRMKIQMSLGVFTSLLSVVAVPDTRVKLPESLAHMVHAVVMVYRFRICCRFSEKVK
jgi:hypothetical protein